MKLEIRSFPKTLRGNIDGYISTLKEAKESLSHELRSLRNLPFEPMPHQLEVARRVIFDMGTRAILADEVGLGKTVEAGLILREKFLRGEIEYALILAPASLALQWKEEMQDKFGMNFVLARNAEDFSANFVVASIHQAKRKPYRSEVISRLWDMVIVDEAHHARNPGTQNYNLIRGINTKFLLLLTATPVSNSLKEIYYLADVLRPGIFGTYREFERRYFRDRKGLQVQNGEELQRALEEIMVRNRRRDVFVDFTSRVVKTHITEMSAGEQNLYDLVLEFSRMSDNKLRVISYAKAATSSPRTVAKMAWKALEREKNIRIRDIMLRMYRAGMDAEFKKIDALNRLVYSVDEGIIFTTYRETQNEIVQVLQDSGFTAFEFHGGMSKEAKNDTLRRFRERGGFLVATDSGGEGLNLQFVNTLINFDLPWNPMRVEQRIGRVHRIGQMRDVYIVNLAYRDTVEEHIIDILDRKIQLFISVIGEIDAILGSFERNFEAIIADILMNSRSNDEIKSKFEKLSNAMATLKSKYDRSIEINDSLFSNFRLGVIESA